jgi:hypothetical protein
MFLAVIIHKRHSPVASPTSSDQTRIEAELLMQQLSSKTASANRSIEQPLSYSSSQTGDVLLPQGPTTPGSDSESESHSDSSAK